MTGVQTCALPICKEIEIIKNFLLIFYYNEKSFSRANIAALKYLKEFPKYWDELSDAFYYAFESSDSEINFYDFAKNYANRSREDEASAREIIYEIFKSNVLDLRAEEPVMSALRPTRV